MASTSESILAQILIVVQDVQTSVAKFGEKLQETTEAVQELSKRVDRIVDEGFPDGDLSTHYRFHERKNLPFWKRFILNSLMK